MSSWSIACSRRQRQLSWKALSYRRGIVESRTVRRFPFESVRTCERGGVQVFAGARWDPFIMDAPAAIKTIETGQLPFESRSSIYLDGKNVLSIVVEIDSARLLGGSALLGVIGETLTRGKLAVRIERTGRPEVKNMLLAPKQFDQGEPGPGDTRPVQLRGRLPVGRDVSGGLPSSAGRQSGVLGRPRREGGLA